MGWLKCFLVILLAGCNAYFSSAAPTTTPHASSSSSPTGSTPSWRSSTSTPSCGSRFLICGEGSGLAVYEQGHCGDPLTSDDVQMSSLVFDSLIQTRYARTEVSSTVQNDAYSTRLFNFTFVIPEAAVVSTVSLTLNGVQYFSSPIKKEGQVINTPTSTSAGISVRDATQFGIRLALAARSTVVFSLTYEELLNRQASEYTHKVHISPGQVVPHLEVRMRITEPTEITSLDLKPFTNDVTSDSTIKASIIKWSGGEAEIQYVPTVTEQIQLAELFQDNPETGLNGYLAISYDVLSPAPGGQLFVHNNYFVHFFSPSLWTGIPKHALFVLDVSGSMSGVKIQQLKDALVSILNHLDAGDSFTVIEFSSSYKVWDLDGTDTLNCHTYQASSDRISAALSKARAMQAGGGTSLNAALLKALKCTNLQNKLDPILVVLTDGQATDASSSAILANVKAANVNNTNIFSLAFGQSADFNFLHSLAHGNGGKAHIIYEGKDAAQQLEDFYSSISTPLLMDVSFNYSDMVDASTKSQFHQYFRGSELVTAGRLKRSGGGMSARVTAKGPGNRNVQYSLQSSDVSVKYSWQDINGNTPIERLWASLALAQQLEDENYPATWTTVGPPTTRPSPPRSLKGSIRDSSSTLVATASPSDTTAMALQYSFVTPSTCIEVNTNVAPTTAAPSTRRPGTTARTSSTGSTSRPSSSTPQYSGTAAATASSMLVPMFCLLLLGV